LLLSSLKPSNSFFGDGYPNAQEDPDVLGLTNDVYVASDTSICAEKNMQTTIIEKNIILLGDPEDFVMVKVFIKQKQNELELVAAICVDGIARFWLVRYDRVYLGISIIVQICMFKAFLQYNQQTSDMFRVVRKKSHSRLN
jgi:hypothetical protein